MTVGALDGIRVLELSQYIAAPVAGKALGEMGADVIKIEAPGRGDPMRRWQSAGRSHSPQFAIYNRAKRGLSLDLKAPGGVDVFLRLADSADVVLENFRPGVMERLGVGWSVLSERNPSLVYCAITGFGADGPGADRPAYDTVISAMGGMYSQIMDLAKPQPVGPAFSDLLAGAQAVQGILAALVARGRSGRGQFVDVSMLRAVIGFLAEPGSAFLDEGEVTVPTTRQRRAQSYGLVSSDGLPFVIHMSVPEKFWLAVTDVMGLQNLRDDPRFAERSSRHDHYNDLDAALKEAALTKTRDQWFALFAASDVPHAPIHGFDTLFGDPVVRHLGVVAELDVDDGPPMRQVGPAMVMGATPLRTGPAAPSLGEHTDQILAECGYAPADIDDLRRSQVV